GDRVVVIRRDEQHETLAPRGCFHREIGIIAGRRTGDGKPPALAADISQTFHVGFLRPQTAFSPAKTSLSGASSSASNSSSACSLMVASASAAKAPKIRSTSLKPRRWARNN